MGRRVRSCRKVDSACTSMKEKVLLVQRIVYTQLPGYTRAYPARGTSSALQTLNPWRERHLYRWRTDLQWRGLVLRGTGDVLKLKCSNNSSAGRVMSLQNRVSNAAVVCFRRCEWERNGNNGNRGVASEVRQGQADIVTTSRRTRAQREADLSSGPARLALSFSGSLSSSSCNRSRLFLCQTKNRTVIQLDNSILLVSPIPLSSLPTDSNVRSSSPTSSSWTTSDNAAVGRVSAVGRVCLMYAYMPLRIY